MTRRIFTRNFERPHSPLCVIASQLTRTALILYLHVVSIWPRALLCRSHYMFNWARTWFNLLPPSLEVLLKTLEEKTLALECERQWYRCLTEIPLSSTALKCTLGCSIDSKEAVFEEP
jgi:hypothetical protein